MLLIQMQWIIINSDMVKINDELCYCNWIYITFFKFKLEIYIYIGLLTYF